MPQQYQALLFPADDAEDELYSRCSRYKQLPEDAQRLVRGYLRAKRDHGARAGQVDWANGCAIPRSTFYEHLARYSADIWPAIFEALQLVGDKAGQAAKMCLDVISTRLCIEFSEGRTTSTLTPTELRVLEIQARMSGLLVSDSPGQSSARISLSDPATGRRIDMSLTTGNQDPDTPPDFLAQLIEGRRRKLGWRPEHEGAAPVQVEHEASTARAISAVPAGAVIDVAPVREAAEGGQVSA